MITYKYLEDKDYNTLCQWWNWFRFTPPPKDFLPQNGTGGIMIFKNNIPVCAGFLYITNSKVFWLEYIVSNPKYKDDDRKQIIQQLILELCIIAKNKGAEYIFTSVKNQHLINHFVKVGFTIGSTNTTEMALKL